MWRHWKLHAKQKHSHFPYNLYKTQSFIIMYEKVQEYNPKLQSIQSEQHGWRWTNNAIHASNNIYSFISVNQPVFKITIVSHFCVIYYLICSMSFFKSRFLFFNSSNSFSVSKARTPKTWSTVMPADFSFFCKVSFSLSALWNLKNNHKNMPFIGWLDNYKTSAHILLNAG